MNPDIYIDNSAQSLLKKVKVSILLFFVLIISHTNQKHQKLPVLRFILSSAHTVTNYASCREIQKIRLEISSPVNLLKS